MRRSLSLRARLVLGVIALAAVGLVAADFATYSELRSFLIGRTDTSLDAAHLAVQSAVFHDAHPGDGGDRDSQPQNAPPSGTPDIAPLTAALPGEYIEVRRPAGHILRTG